MVHTTPTYTIQGGRGACHTLLSMCFLSPSTSCQTKVKCQKIYINYKVIYFSVHLHVGKIRHSLWGFSSSIGISDCCKQQSLLVFVKSLDSWLRLTRGHVMWFKFMSLDFGTEIVGENSANCCRKIRSVLITHFVDLSIHMNVTYFIINGLCKDWKKKKIWTWERQIVLQQLLSEF